MIRYPITCADLKAKIQYLSPNWLPAARTAHEKFIKDRQYSEISLHWSTIKALYMELQFGKCIYCERSLEDFSIEHDVEHFRPKNSVKAWPDAKYPEHPVYYYSTGHSLSKGYFWLAYSPWNYATSCKSCNSALKANYFPIAGQRGQAGQSIPLLRTERAFLIYPIGYLDEDPEKLITFDGVVAHPLQKSGEKYRRAQVTIDFFRLNGRAHLIDERATQISILGYELKRVEEALTENDRRKLYRRIMSLCSAASPHAACKRVFRRLWYSNPQHAGRVFDECRLHVEDIAKRKGGLKAE
jgi:hypothetical protein